MTVSGQVDAPATFLRGEKALDIPWIEGWVSPTVRFNAEAKRKISSSRRESNPRTPIVQTVPAKNAEQANFM